MTWTRLIPILIPVVVGSAEKGGSVPTSGDRGAGRIALPESPQYKILRDEEDMMMLRAGKVRITIFPLNDRMLEIAKAGWSKMSSDIPKTQFGDTVVPATRFRLDEVKGLKILFLRKGSEQTFQSKYLLEVAGGNVQVHMEGIDGETFNETSFEPILSTIRVDRGDAVPGNPDDDPRPQRGPA